MDKIVYILGAGFSAPIGIPVMSNFIERSKDIYYQNPDLYPYFIDIFQMIKEKSYCKNFIEADLYNIEDLLSMLEMENYLGGSNSEQLELYKRYLKDVIKYFTPKNTINEDIYTKNYVPFYKQLFGKDYIWYGIFLSCLAGLSFRRDLGELRNKNPNKFFIDYNDSTTEYSVVTLNYDIIVENVFAGLLEIFDDQKYINSNHLLEERLNFSKLHGSVDDEIILPTWNKTGSSSVVLQWQNAYKSIKNANQIRFLGYSLPDSDSYIKYLLSTAINESKNLKNIDVITLDDDKNMARDRYKGFFHFKKFRFKNDSIQNYITHICGDIKQDNQDICDLSNIIEEGNRSHDLYMDKSSD